MARTYKRDSRGRFAGGGGGGGGGGGRPAARKAPRGTNRLTRDNAGRITGTGNGATARGGRLRTASGGLRATQVAKVKGGGGRLRGRKGNAGAVKAVENQKSRAESRALANYNRALRVNGTRKEANRAAVTMATATRALESLRGLQKPGPRRGYTSKGAPPKRAQKPSKGKTLPHSEAMSRRTEAMLKRGVQTGNRAQSYLRDRGALSAPIGSRLSSAEGRAGRVVWSNRNRLASFANQRLNAARRERRGGFS